MSMDRSPKISDIRDIYTSMLCTDQEFRLSAIREALVWCDTTLPFELAKGPIPAERTSTLRRYEKCRDLATGEATPIIEAEHSGKMALQLFESLFAGRIAMPEVAKVYQELETDRQELEQKELRMKQRFDVVVNTLNQTYGSLGLNFAVWNGRKERQFDANGQVLLSKRYLETQLAAGGVMGCVFRMADACIKATSIERNALGKPMISAAKLQGQINVVIEQLLAYAQGAGASTGAGVVYAPPAPVVSKVRKPRVQAPATGAYRPGTKLYAVFQRLSDGQVWLDVNLFEGLGTIPYPHRILSHIKAHGVKTGKWSMIRRKGSVQLVMH